MAHPSQTTNQWVVFDPSPNGRLIIRNHRRGRLVKWSEKHFEMIQDSSLVSSLKMPAYSGWWFEPLWKILVNWDDYSQHMGKEKMFQTTNQYLSLGIIMNQSMFRENIEKHETTKPPPSTCSFCWPFNPSPVMVYGSLGESQQFGEALVSSNMAGTNPAFLDEFRTLPI